MSQFSLDRLGGYLKVVVSIVSNFSQAFASQFGIAFFVGENKNVKLISSVVSNIVFTFAYLLTYHTHSHCSTSVSVPS